MKFPKEWQELIETHDVQNREYPRYAARAYARHFLLWKYKAPTVRKYLKRGVLINEKEYNWHVNNRPHILSYRHPSRPEKPVIIRKRKPERLKWAT